MTKLEKELRDELKKINKIISDFTLSSEKVAVNEEKSFWAKKRIILAKLNPLNELNK